MDICRKLAQVAAFGLFLSLSSSVCDAIEITYDQKSDGYYFTDKPGSGSHPLTVNKIHQHLKDPLVLEKIRVALQIDQVEDFLGYLKEKMHGSNEMITKKKISAFHSVSKASNIAPESCSPPNGESVLVSLRDNADPLLHMLSFLDGAEVRHYRSLSKEDSKKALASLASRGVNFSTFRTGEKYSENELIQKIEALPEKVRREAKRSFKTAFFRFLTDSRKFRKFRESCFADA